MSYYFLFHEDDHTKPCGHITETCVRVNWTTEEDLVNYFAQKNIDLVLYNDTDTLEEDQSDIYGERVTLNLLKRNSGPDCHVALDGYGMPTAGGTPLQIATTYQKLAQYVYNSWLNT